MSRTDQPSPSLPWEPGIRPLMLAPMQGLTNRELRAAFAGWARPDVVYTEYLRVQTGKRAGLSSHALLEVTERAAAVPQVTQLIGRDREALVRAAEAAQQAGAEHLDLNLGCPFGRLSLRTAGGALLQSGPQVLAPLLVALRRAISVSFSVKLRSGFEDPRQIFELAPVLEQAGVDFLVLHPRTVVQRFEGRADHAITAELVRRTALPVIANGDVRSAAQGRAVLEQTGAAGLMIGRGAIRDPLIFERIRGNIIDDPATEQRADEVRRFLGALLPRYAELFSGEDQALYKLKEVLKFIDDEPLRRTVKKLRKCRSLRRFEALLAEF